MWLRWMTWWGLLASWMRDEGCHVVCREVRLGMKAPTSLGGWMKARVP